MNDDNLFDVVLTISFFIFGTQCLLSDSIFVSYVLGPLFILFTSFGVYRIWEDHT